MPNIGHGSHKKTRHVLPCGLKKLTVNNTRELELLLMHNKGYAAEIASAVSARKRVEIIEKAKVLGVKVLNSGAKVTVAEA
ncbi:hypothetical protein JCM10207_003209 [Rhodosporidiobolus poonsookiae]